MWDYTDKVRDHFLNPRNVGVIDQPDGVGEVGSLACGDALKLTFKLDKDGKIADAKFQTFGCASAIAASSALTEMIKGKPLEYAEKITNQDIAEFLGGLPEQKMHCSVMGKEALEAAIENYRGSNNDGQKQQFRVVCICFGITDNEIARLVKENGLRTVEEVTNYCKAGGGCGGCHSDIQKIIEENTPKTPDESEEMKTKQKKGRLTNIEKIKLVQQTLDQQVRPALQADGGDLELIDVDGDKVLIALRGMCAKCQVSEFTIADVVQARLREFVSEDIIVQESKDENNIPR